MTPFAAKVITHVDQKVFREIRQLLSDLPDIDYTDHEGKPYKVSCHILSCALAQVFPDLTVVHGYYFGHFQHSWLRTRAGNIIDVYPVGSLGGPQLLDAQYPAPASYPEMFEEKALCNVYFDDETFVRVVEDIVQVMRNYSELAHEASVLYTVWKDPDGYYSAPLHHWRGGISPGELAERWRDTDTLGPFKTPTKALNASLQWAQDIKEQNS